MNKFRRKVVEGRWLRALADTVGGEGTADQWVKAKRKPDQEKKEEKENKPSSNNVMRETLTESLIRGDEESVIASLTTPSLSLTDLPEDALHLALENSFSTETILLLIDKKANINFQEKKEGDTPLHVAIDSNAEVVKLLLEQKADPRISNESNKTPMDAIEESHHPEKVVMKSLLSTSSVFEKPQKSTSTSQVNEIEHASTTFASPPASKAFYPSS